MVVSTELIIFYILLCNLGIVVVATSVDKIYKYNILYTKMQKTWIHYDTQAIVV